MIPDFLKHLPTYGEYAVPYVQHWADGKPDFRVIDAAKMLRVAKEKLCAICGRKLGEFSYWAGGDKCKTHHLFVDGPMHRECALYTASTCPYVSGKRREYSERKLPQHDDMTMKVHPMANTVSMWILKSRTKKTEVTVDHQSVVFKAGSWLGETSV